MRDANLSRKLKRKDERSLCVCWDDTETDKRNDYSAKASVARRAVERGDGDRKSETCCEQRRRRGSSRPNYSKVDIAQAANLSCEKICSEWPT